MMTAFGGSGCATMPDDLHYKSSAFREKDATFSRASKIVIEIDPEVSIQFRDLLAKVEIAAKAAGLNCTTLEDAEYLIFVTTAFHVQPAQGNLAEFGIKGKAYRLSDGGKKRAIRNEWEAAASGRKGIRPISANDRSLRPPWVDVDVIAARFVATIGIEKTDDK
jgi:hypothetical protein